MTDKRDEMPKAYEPAKVEQKWYQHWLERGYFTPRIDPRKKPFVIIMPPPNVTGELHLGHALESALQDVMTRWHRMKGEPTLWLPGVDHAAIAAQVVVERQLAKEGLTRHQLGREKFLERMHQWVKECRHTITEQRMKLGASCDWSRERYTMDEVSTKAVRTAFIRLYNKGLIYRGERIINWCPRCATALSDLETDHKEIQGHLYYVRYPLAGDGGEFITVATTRPETILGDTAVAVNPGDKRFKAVVGKRVVLPVLKREIPIVADEVVDVEFGTGAVKVTPAHDPVDFDISQRQGLSLINILNADVTMNENAGPYTGLDRFACRQAILDDLEKEGLLVKVEPYTHSVGHCHRCHTIVEPIASQQWFVRMAPLAKPAIEVVKDGRITIIPERFAKVYLNWMENIRDWCISRQLWWGHQIPIWYCRDCDGLTVAVETPAACSKCGSTDIEQDPDTLDTWFSSGLWPHSTLGWPDDTEDFRYFYPTTVMETAYDLIFFWVARMIFMGIEDTGEIPFRTIYFHGLIRDEKGEKMSKTRGNVVDPLKVVAQYGTDALRFALVMGTSAGNDSKIASAKFEAGRNFANKLWNATRFVIRSFDTGDGNVKIQRDALPVEDRWILSRLSDTAAAVNRLIGDYQFGEAQSRLYEFLWGEFCDWYIEIAKIRLGAGKDVPSPVPVLVYVLETSLRLLHPFMPFITEELWQNLRSRAPVGGETDSIMVAAYPAADEAAIDPEAERVMAAVIEIIRAIRNARTENRVEAGRQVEARIYAGELKTAIAAYNRTIQALAKARVTVCDRSEYKAVENALALVLKESEVVIPMASMFDAEAERRRLCQEIEQTRAEVSRLEAMLNDGAFLAKAPEAVVARERARLADRQDNLKRLEEHLGRLEP